MRRPFLYLLLAVIAGVLSWNCTYQKSQLGGGSTAILPTVSPMTPSVPLGAPQKFTVSISNGDNLAWYVGQLEGDGTLGSCPATSPCGSLSISSATTGTAAGVSFTYTAPTAMPQAIVNAANNPNTVTLLVVDTTSKNPNPPSATATITLTTNLAVTVAPQTANAEASNPTGITFTPTVSNDPSMGGVNWSLSSPGNTCTGTGPTPCGSISAASSANKTSITYTAPASTAGSFKVTLTATSVTTSTVSNFATIMVTPAIAVSVAPLTANIAASNRTGIPFTATVPNDVNSAGVTWALSSPGVTCSGTTTCGSLSATSSISGTAITYTAPAAAAATFPVTLTATSVADGSKSNAATITITPPISVNVTAPTASATVGSTTSIPITATVDNDGNDGGVTWTLSTTGGACGGTTCGAMATISSASGAADNYTPPPTAAATFMVTLTATSVTDTTKFGTFIVTISAPPKAILRYVFEAASAPPSGLTISSYAVLPSTGQLRSLTYFVPSGLGGGGITGPTPTTAIHPNGTVLYVLAPSIPSSAQLWTLTLGPNGVLQQTASSPVTLSTEFQSLTVDPLGQLLYTIDQFGGAIDVLPLDQNGNPGSPAVAASLSEPTQMIIDPTGSYLFAASTGGGSGTVSIFSISRGSGAPGALTSLGTPQPSGTDNTCMTVTPNGQLLYLFSDSTLYAFNVTPTGLTPVTGSPFNGLLGTSAPGKQMVVDPSGKYLYVTAQGPDRLYGFSIGTSGTLTALTSSPFTTGSFPDEVNVDPSGSFVYVANREDVWVYSLNSSTGALTATSQMRTRGFGVANQLLSSGSSALTFTPTALYVANTGSNNISQFPINPSTGALGAGTTVSAGTAPKAVAVLPDGDFAYAANSAIGSGTPTLSAYSISNGVLTPSGSPVTTGNGPTWLTPDPSGTWMYNVNQTDSSIWKFTINSSGPLTSGAKATTTGTGPVFVTTDPTGQYLYTANNTAGTIGEYSIEMPEGLLSVINASLSAEGTQPVSIAVDPSGSYVYVAEMNNNNGGVLAEYTLTEGSGDLVVNGPQPFLPVGNALSSVVVEPTGKYIFVSDFMLNKIYSYTINSGVGDLAFNTVSEPVASTGTGPVALAVDISGQYLYCVNSGSNDISIFKINLTNGTLTQVGTTTVPTGGTTPAGIATTGTIN
jgi:6-phosphogluconolactonase (cycloisomerase 2 family)